MKTLVVYESMYGNTHEVAERVAEGLRAGGEVEVVSVGGATAERLAGADLVVVGGPTHVHGMTSAMSRKTAVDPETVAKSGDEDHDVHVDPDAEGPGLRDWFTEVDIGRPVLAAGFDTRMEGPPALTGRASKGITHRLKRHGFNVVADPESFLVDKQNVLLEGEAYRATMWGADLLAKAAGQVGQAAAEG